MYTSTRKKLKLTASKAIIKGISEDGGLFIPIHLNHFQFDESFCSLSYQQLSKAILDFYLDDFTKDEIAEIVDETYSSTYFKENIVKIKNFNEISFLELYHGPTLSFKDMALTMLPSLMEKAKVKNKNFRQTVILTATSGDTGGAALAGFSKAKNIQIIVLYPTHGVSNFQEKQMYFYTNHQAKVIGIEGNFDDCQNLVKKIFTTSIFENIELSSANSINIGRLIPQVIYYFYAYFQLVKQKEINFGDKINVVVPTGNFGNILACYLAKKMGLFIDKMICASNENHVLTDFFNTKIYDCKRPFYVTNSPAMDILVSSNLERLLYMITEGDEVLVKKLMQDLAINKSFYLPDKYHNKLQDFKAFYIDKEKTIFYMNECFKRYNYLIDPHTAVAYGAFEKLKKELKGKTLIISTASPFKFIDTVNEIFHLPQTNFALIQKVSDMSKMPFPSSIQEIYQSSEKYESWKKEEAEERLRKIIGELDENC